MTGEAGDNPLNNTGGTTGAAAASRAAGAQAAPVERFGQALSSAEMEAVLGASGFGRRGSASGVEAAAADPLGATMPVEDVQSFVPPDLSGGAAGGGVNEASAIELLGDVTLEVKVELGRSRMLVEDVLRLTNGSVVELDKLAGDPVDVYVNERLVARGEVLVLNDDFCVRISEIVTPAEEPVSA